MIIDQTLLDILQYKIAKIKEHPRSAQKEVEEIMLRKFNVSYGTTIDIFNGLLPLETLSDDILYKLMVSLQEMIINNDRYRYIGANDLYPSKYFNEYQIKQYEKPFEKDEDDTDIIFDQWLQVAHDQYVCVVSVDKIVEWRNLNKIKYNPKTQRELTEKTTKGGIVIKVVTIFKKALKEIGEKMENNEHIPDDITFNINPDYYEEPRIIRGKLVIPKESRVDIIDGFHRYLKMCDTKDKISDWKYKCIVNVMVFNEEKAQRYMIQKDKKNHLSKKQLIRMDKSDKSNYVVSRLNESSDFHHKGKIDDDTFVLLVKLISELFNPQDRAEAVQLSKTIENNINKIIEDKNLYDSALSKNEWFMYIYLLKKCDCNTNTFFKVVKKFNSKELLEKIKFINQPAKQHYKTIDTIFNEVINDE